MRHKPDLARVASISREVELRSVSCREFQARRQFELAEGPNELNWSGTHDVSGHRDIESSEIVVVAKFQARAHAADQLESGAPAAEVSATIALRYVLNPDTLNGLDVNAVQEFAETNGVYNAWPYWRELLQHSAGRIGMQGVVAPVFRLVAQPNAPAGHSSK
jgi:hypothetical protein